MVEESETPGYGPAGEGRGRQGEGDLLAERRARRAAESGEAALTRRAEAAEATVQTLERHVASLQQRLREAEDEQRRMAGVIEAERVGADEREAELRRVKQREYAEQQLRVEAEERLVGTERDGRDELRRLGERLGADERETRELSARVEELQRQLAEAEQAAASERSALVRAESELQIRVAGLERRTEEIATALEAERSARRRTEQELRDVREGNRRMEGVLGEVKGIVGRLAGAFASSSPPVAPTPPPAMLATSLKPAPPELGEPRGAEMAEALAAAVERLRARAENAPETSGTELAELAPESSEDPGAGLGRAPLPPHERSAPTASGPLAQVVTEPSERPGAAAAEPVSEPGMKGPAGKPHKHSMSLIGRLRNRRKQRRSR